MDSVKWETKCIMTIGTVNSRTIPIEGQTVEFYCVNQVCKSRSARAKEIKRQSDMCGRAESKK